jgi:quercetin dioxygenase-like cupin family protein
MSLQPKLDAFNAWAPFVAPRLVVNLAGSRFVVLATALETNGVYSAFEISVPPGAGTPLHAHTEQEAVFYVVRGHLRFQVDEGSEERGSGSLVHVAKNVPHLFVNVRSEEAAVIVIARPGGIERFFLKVGIKIGATDAPIAAKQEDFERISPFAPAYGITFFPEWPHPGQGDFK